MVYVNEEENIISAQEHQRKYQLSINLLFINLTSDLSPQTQTHWI